LRPFSMPAASRTGVASAGTSARKWEKAIEFKRKATLEWSALTLKRPELKDS